jgi:transcriptional regulator with XRE-family HTH domain
MMKRKYPVIDVAKTGQKIKQIMQREGVSVKDIQDFLELSTPQSIYHWFDGRNLPTVDNLYALSEFFHMPIDAFLVGDRNFEYAYPFDMHQRMLVYFEKIMKLKAC